MTEQGDGEIDRISTSLTSEDAGSRLPLGWRLKIETARAAKTSEKLAQLLLRNGQKVVHHGERGEENYDYYQYRIELSPDSDYLKLIISDHKKCGRNLEAYKRKRSGGDLKIVVTNRTGSYSVESTWSLSERKLKHLYAHKKEGNSYSTSNRKDWFPTLSYSSNHKEHKLKGLQDYNRFLEYITQILGI